jgi:hypothetical protein
MANLKLATTAFLLSLGLTTSPYVLSAAPEHGYGYQAYPAPYENLRGLVDRTQSDLTAAMQLEHRGGDQHKRYNDAQGHLSSFDRHLVKGHFDKGELGKAIDSIKSILDKNVLQASSRDALMRDLEELRSVRDRY